MSKINLCFKFLVLVCVFSFMQAEAKTNSKKVKLSKPFNLSTDIQFSDASVRGKYQVGMEAIGAVENEKSLEDLLGVRKNFKDRIQQDESRN